MQSNYSVFKEGVKPMWEDVANKKVRVSSMGARTFERVPLPHRRATIFRRVEHRVATRLGSRPLSQVDVSPPRLARLRALPLDC